MVFGSVILGSLVGLLAAFIAVVAFGASLWIGLLAWWGMGTVAALLPLVLIVLLPDEQDLPEGQFARDLPLQRG